MTQQKVQLKAKRALTTKLGRTVVEDKCIESFVVPDETAKALNKQQAFKYQFGVLLDFLESVEPTHFFVPAADSEDQNAMVNFFENETSDAYVSLIIHKAHPDFTAIHRKNIEKYPYDGEVFSYLRVTELPDAPHFKTTVSRLISGEYEPYLVISCYDNQATNGGSDG